MMAAENRDDIINHSHPAEYSSEQPQWLRDQLKWFTGLKFGIIVHWGPYSQWDCYESWPLVPADTWARPEGLAEWNERDRDLKRFQKDYWELNRTFNPEGFKPEEWAELFRNAGAKYVALTTKHHDGFCLWDTSTTDYRITHPSCPYSHNPRSNVIREAFAAFRSSGLAVSCYFSKSDWKHPSYWSPDFPVTDRNPNYDTEKNPECWEQFVKFVHEQIRELMRDCGKIDLLWLDGGQVRPPKQDICMNEIVEMAREFQPGLIVADRTVGGEFENIITPEVHIPEEPLGVSWEACIPLGKNWKYVSNETYKSTGELIRMLVETVSKGGNLMLGVGPSPEGKIEGEVRSRLDGIGRWLKVNGDAIYETNPLAPYAEENIFYTEKRRVRYAIVFADKKPLAELRLKTIRPESGDEIHMLGVGRLFWRKDNETALVSLPDNIPCEHAFVLTIHRGSPSS